MDVSHTVAAAAANAFDAVLGHGVADLRPLPAAIVDEGPQRTVYRYLTSHPSRHPRAPVLLVPPLAVPASCFDLHRGCTLAGHLRDAGHPTYLVDYGTIAFSDRELGLEHWIADVIPTAVEVASEDSGGRPVHLVGWCLGGIMSLLSVAAYRLPVASITAIASPFDLSRVPIISWLHPFVELTRGRLGTALYRLLGGAPAPLVKRAFKLSSLDKQLTKPWALATHLDDREFLAQIEAVDDFTEHMVAYPGRTFGQLYHRFFRANDLAGGRFELPDGPVDLSAVDVTVLVVAGEEDVIAPRAAAHHVSEALRGAPAVVLRSAPGGHLGVLTGRAAKHTTWAYLDEFLRAQDGDAAPGPRSGRRGHLQLVA